jgi:hypothetical protein
LAKGGGSVWAAEQREPVKRRVALKIIKLGVDTKQVVARFEAGRRQFERAGFTQPSAGWQPCDTAD